jgi:hypothetical protein
MAVEEVVERRPAAARIGDEVEVWQGRLDDDRESPAGVEVLTNPSWEMRTGLRLRGTKGELHIIGTERTAGHLPYRRRLPCEPSRLLHLRVLCVDRGGPYQTMSAGASAEAMLINIKFYNTSFFSRWKID